MFEKEEEQKELTTNATEDPAEEPATVIRDRNLDMVKAWTEQTGLDLACIAGTNVKMELSETDCLQYDIPTTWIGVEACFSTLLIFDGAYTVDPESVLEFEWMSAISADLDAVIGCRDNSMHSEFAKRGITVEITDADVTMPVWDELFEEFALELVHLNDEARDVITFMADFQMQVLQGGSMLCIMRYFEEYMQLEVNA